MKYLWTVCITPQPCHSHFSCWLVPIWPLLDFWAESGAYGLCRLCCQYNGAKLYFYWPYMLVSMIWNTSELSASQLSRATAIFVVDCCQFGLNWIFGLKMELMAVPAWLAVQRIKDVFFLTLYDSINDVKYLRNCLQYTSAVPQPFLLLIGAKLAQAGCLGWKWSLWLCRLGYRYNGVKQYFSWYYMIVSMIWNTYEMSASHISRDTAIFLLLMAANLAQAGCFYYQWYETLPNSLHHTASCLGLFSPI